MYRHAENQCHCCDIYHFQRPDLICETPARDPASLPSMRFPCSRERMSSQKRQQSNFRPTQKRAHAQESCTMSQKQTSLKFKTEIHSIRKAEAELKFIGALTKFHYMYRHVERNNDKLRRAKSDKPTIMAIRPWDTW